MKRFLILLFITCSAVCTAQNLSFSKVIPAPEKTAADIYNATKIWSATAFANAKNSTQVDNPENYFVSFNSNISYSFGTVVMLAYDGWINFTLTVQCKDGRYKVEMANIKHENKPTNARSCELGLMNEDESSYKGPNKKVALDIKQKSSILFDSLCESLDKSIQKGIEIQDDNW